MRWLLNLVVYAIVFLGLTNILDGFYVSSFSAAFIAAFILYVLNGIVKPILVVLTLPVTILSLGLFLFVINAITLSLTDVLMGSSFTIHSFGQALLVGIILSIVKMLLDNNKKK